MTDTERAVAAWLSRKAYWDGRNYRVRSFGSTSGPIAPWNKSVKREVGGPDNLHALAHRPPAAYDWDIAPGGLQASAFPEHRAVKPAHKPGTQLGLFRRVRSRAARRRGLR